MKTGEQKCLKGFQVETDSGSSAYKTNIKNYDQEMYQQNLYQLIWILFSKMKDTISVTTECRRMQQTNYFTDRVH